MAGVDRRLVGPAAASSGNEGSLLSRAMGDTTAERGSQLVGPPEQLAAAEQVNCSPES